MNGLLIVKKYAGVYDKPFTFGCQNKLLEKIYGLRIELMYDELLEETVSRNCSKKEPPLLNIIDGEAPIKEETCFNVHKQCNVSCEMSDCRYWQEMEGPHQNCVINAANSGSLTLQEVGDIFSVTRMRICQIEKSAKEILKTLFDKNENML